MIDAVGTYRTVDVICRSGAISYGVAPKLASRPTGSCKATNATEPGLVGTHLSSMMQADLVTFFNFVRANIQIVDGLSVVLFKPGNAQFAGDVSLVAATDGDSCVRAISLTVRRSFLQSAATAPLGRDLVASLLGNALTIAGIRQVAALITEIRRPSSSFAEFTMEPRNLEALNVFLGKEARVERTLGPDRIRMENTAATDGAPLLRITIW